jgi:hypothetical protein
MPRAADPSVGVHQLTLSKAKPLSAMEKRLSRMVSGVGGGRDARNKERQERALKQKEADAIKKRAGAVLNNLTRVMLPKTGVHELEALSAAVKRGEAVQEDLPQDPKLRNELAAAMKDVRAVIAALEAQERSSAAARRASDSPSRPTVGGAGGAAGRQGGGAAGGAAGRQGVGAAGAAEGRRAGREVPYKDFLALLAAAEERDLNHLADCPKIAQKAAGAKAVGAAAAVAAGLASRASAR